MNYEDNYFSNPLTFVRVAFEEDLAIVETNFLYKK